MTTPGLLMDAHVHLHDPAIAPALFDAAYRNLRRLGGGSPVLNAYTCTIMLAEMRRQEWFEELFRTRPRLGAWQVQSGGDDSAALFAVRTDGARLLIVAGHQLVTAEGIEVLLLACRQKVGDGMKLQKAIVAGKALRALVVLPWGAGKWLGRRGKLVARAFLDAPPGTVFLGDIAGRPALWPRPRLFWDSIARGVPVLPGSDPLPLSGEHLLAGARGCIVRTRLPGEHPAAELVEALASGRAAVEESGASSELLPFVRKQVALRLRIGARPAAQESP